MSDDSGDDPSFEELVVDVLPLKGDTVVSLKRAREITPGTLERRRAAEALATGNANSLPTEHIDRKSVV